MCSRLRSKRLQSTILITCMQGATPGNGVVGIAIGSTGTGPGGEKRKRKRGGAAGVEKQVGQEGQGGQATNTAAS